MAYHLCNRRIDSETILLNGNASPLQESLLSWFEVHQRSFPWRETRNPYEILIAEKLLQQTTARTSVIEAFQILVERYPSPAALAQADLDDLLMIIKSLGFHYRARELKSLGIELVDKYGGKVPNDLHELMRLPGVGEYIARAVLSFAYGQDMPVVDTNVARFLYRLFGISDPLPANPSRKQSLYRIAAQLMPLGRSRDFNLAILDLCAEICTSHNPQCNSCPIWACCEYGNSVSLSKKDHRA